MADVPEITSLQKRAVFKIALDLIKADYRIHSKEISVLDQLQTSLCLSQEEMDMIHYLTLAEAVNALREMDEEQAKGFLDLFNGIMRVDSDISFRENLLLTAVTMACSSESRDWVHVISSSTTDIPVSDNQIIFLEKEYSHETHLVLDDKYDNLLISKAFNDIGLQFFYLPSVLKELGLIGGSATESNRKYGLLQKSMSYLRPSGNKNKIENIERILDTFDTRTFFKVVMSGLNLTPDFFPFSSFIMIKIRQGYVLDDRNNSSEVVDLMCIDITKKVKKRVLSFVSNFTEHSSMLPYEGYYKMLYDYLSSEAKITSSILVDSEMHFRMENVDNQKVTFESSPQSRTLYLALLYYGRKGLNQSVINNAVEYLQSGEINEIFPEGGFNIEVVKNHMLKLGTDWSILIYNTIQIYQAISTKDEQKANYLSYICSILNHRSSLKTYINRGFNEIGGLSNPEQYHVKFDKEFNIYWTEASESLFYCLDDGDRVPISESRLWKTLK